ncbi:glycosyltransferase family 39 protein [Virgibacillus sp. MSP4-1]|uniref:glycosyltransferase family 39 protein n=1 Tax=Virgibacillus sp. MSP4-1 TaxID=2700081 RepID=UPI0003A5D8A1|nr:glycosyltransferase family 39 protein [Virgibacillus sp. MSP4-1]QHS23507.1 glycosyltransferase family 39 protein [Virgibacillus sp. MSP4-1]
MDTLKRNIPILIILGMVLLFHLYLLRFGDPIQLTAPDEKKYSRMAETIIEEKFYSYQGGGPDAYVTPGHPFYLVSSFLLADIFNIDRIKFTVVLNLIMNLLTILIIYHIAHRLFHNQTISVMATSLFAFTLAQYHYFRHLLTEVPGAFTFYLAVLLFIIAFQENQKKWHILFGFAAAYSLMVRPTPAPMLLLAYGIILYRYKWKESLKIGLLWWVGPLFIILPWSIRNYLAFQQFHLFSSHAGNPMLGGTDPFYLRDKPISLAREGSNLGFSNKEYAIERIKEGLKNNPVLWISWFTLGKTLWMFREPDRINYFSLPQWGVTLYYLHHFFVLIGGTLTAWFLRHNGRIAALTGVIIIFVAVSNVFLPLTRYAQFIVPVFCILVAVGIQKFYQYLFDIYKDFLSKSTLE